MKKIAIIGVIAISFFAMKPVDNFLVLTIQKFGDYTKANPQVKVHLVFNQNKFAGGDTIFFKSFFLDAENKFVKGKQILEAEIVDEQGNGIIQISYRVVDGTAENQVIIPKDVKPGKYTLISYSQWMKNFDAKYFFIREFSIASRFQINSEAKGKEPITVAVFPEGGTLVVGVSNNIVIKANINGEVSIKDKDGKLVSTYFLDKNGFGKGKLMPALEGKYFAEIGTQLIPIGQAKTNSISAELQAKGNRNEAVELKLTVATNSIFKNQLIYLISTSRNKITFSKTIQFSEIDSVKISLPPKAIEEGLNQVFILDNQGNVLVERVFWTDPTPVNVSIKTEKLTLLNREKSYVEALLTDYDGNPLQGEGSVSITNASLFTDGGNSFCRDILLSDLPDLNNEIIKIGMTDEQWSIKANDYLVASSWNRIPWKDIVSEKWIKPVNKIKYSLSLKGKAIFKDSKEPLPDSSKITIYLQKHLIGYDIYTRKEGNFDLPYMYDFWGEDKLFFIAEKNGKEFKNEVSISIESSKKSVAIGVNPTKQNDKPDLYGEFKSKKEVIDKSFNFYTSSTKEKLKVNSPNQEFEDELGEPDWQIKTDDYVVFSTMEEVIHELLSFIKFRKKDNLGTIRMVLIEGGQNKYSSADPLFIIDGSMTRDITLFLSLKPKDILTIKIVRDKQKLLKLGNIAKNGLIIVHTKNGVGGKLTATTNNISVIGLNLPIPFYLKEYSKSNNLRIPDFRSTVLWNPTVKLDEMGKGIFNFYTSDDTGELDLSFNGFTKEGKPFYSRKRLNVIPK